MSNKIAEFGNTFMKDNIPSFKSGDTIRVHLKIKEGDKERIQVFEGVVIRKQGEGINSSFIVRKISYGIGVEKIIPLHSPNIVKIEIVTLGRVRRSKIYYLRQLHGKATKVKEKREHAKITRKEEQVNPT